jgi:hypothetical protein
MTARLETLRAERDGLEQAEKWDHPAYDWLCEQVEALEAAEAAGQATQAPTPTTAPAGDPIQALVVEMERAAANPGRLTDAERDDLVRRYNAAGRDAAWRAEAETAATDVAQVRRDMIEAAADPSKLSDEQRADVVGRYNRLARQQQPVARPDSPDLAERMEAARQAQERGEEVDVAGLMAQFGTWQEEQLAASRDPATSPPELQDAGKVLYAAEAEMGRPADPVEAAIGDLNRYVRGMRPPTGEEQLAALGVEPEPESIRSTSAQAGEIMSKRGTNPQNTTTGGSSDGSAPVHGLDLLAGSGGTKQRQYPVVEADFSDSRSGPSIDAYRDFERISRDAARAVNAGVPDGSGPAPGYDALGADKGGRPTGAASSDPTLRCVF